MIKGVIGRRAVIQPSSEWAIGQLELDATVDVDVTLHSEISNNFKLLKVENPSGRITTKSRPLTDEELEDIAGDNSAATEDKEKLSKVVSEGLRAGFLRRGATTRRYLAKGMRGVPPKKSKRKKVASSKPKRRKK